MQRTYEDYISERAESQLRSGWCCSAGGGEVIEIQHKQSDQIRHGNGVAWAMPTSFIHLRIDCHTSYRSAQPPSGTSKHQFHSNADVGSSGGKTTAAGDGEWNDALFENDFQFMFWQIEYELELNLFLVIINSVSIHWLIVDSIDYCVERGILHTTHWMLVVMSIYLTIHLHLTDG